jgi:hypothetical protein
MTLPAGTMTSPFRDTGKRKMRGRVVLGLFERDYINATCEPDIWRQWIPLDQCEHLGIVQAIPDYLWV